MKKISAIFFIVLSVALCISNLPQQPGVTFVSPENVAMGIGNAQDDLNALNAQIAAIQAQKAALQQQLDANNYRIGGYNSKISELYGQAQIYQQSIDELKLQIQQIELNIKILEDDIAQKKADIKVTEDNVANLEKESTLRLQNGYVNYRLYGGEGDATDILKVKNINDFFKDSQYKEFIQKETNGVISQLALLKQTLNQKKQELDQKVADQQKDKEVIVTKKSDLDKKNEELQLSMNQYYAELYSVQASANGQAAQIQAISQDEIQKKAQAQALIDQIFGGTSSISSGQYIAEGQPIGRKGSTGYSTAPHLHFMTVVNGQYQDPCNYLQGGVPGCGGGGSLKVPLMGDVGVTSGFGYRCFNYNGTQTCDFHNGVDLVSNPWNATVFAAHSGYAYSGVDGYGAIYVIICENTNCNVGIKNGYWHLSESFVH